MLGLAAPTSNWRERAFRRRLARLGGAVIAAATLLLALYLVYIQADVVHAWCEWCLASDAVFAAFAALTVVRATR